MSLHTLPDAERTKRLTTAELRDRFLVQDLFQDGQVTFRFVDLDRVVLGGAVPTDGPLDLGVPDALAAGSFTERREVGILNIGGAGTVMVGEETYALGNRDLLYVGRGSEAVSFASDDAATPARYYLVSYPCHAEHPTTLIRKAEAELEELGSQAKANRRDLFKYVRPGGVESGARTLKDAMNEALRDWVANVHDTFYIIGTAAGPHPYPELVRDFQSVIGTEAKAQLQARTGRLPDLLVAAIGGGSNAIGLFHPFLDDPDVKMLGVEAAGEGLEKKHAASLAGGAPGILHGNKTYLLQDEDGQIAEAHSISAGLDYPGIGPEHSWLKDSGRVDYVSATDEEALSAFQLLCKTEGIIPALEPAHAIAKVIEAARDMDEDRIVLANLCGRGDKDIFTVADALGVAI